MRIKWKQSGLCTCTGVPGKCTCAQECRCAADCNCEKCQNEDALA